MVTLHQMDYLCTRVADDSFRVTQFKHPAEEAAITFRSYEAVLEALTPFKTEQLDEGGNFTLLHCYYVLPSRA